MNIKRIKSNIEEQLSQTERGQSMVELALSFTILLMLVAGVIDLGRAFFTWVALRDAAQEGALYGSICPPDPGTGDITHIEERVRDTSSEPVDMSLPSDGSDPDVDVIITIGGTSLGSPITVTVIYDQFPITVPFLGTVLGSDTLTIRASITDSILDPECNNID